MKINFSRRVKNRAKSSLSVRQNETYVCLYRKKGRNKLYVKIYVIITTSLMYDV